MSLNCLEKKRMKKRQAGMTTMGLIILVAFVGLFAFAGLRLTPVYLNYMKIAGIVEGVREEFDGTGASRADVRQSLRRRSPLRRSMSDRRPEPGTIPPAIRRPRI